MQHAENTYVFKASWAKQRFLMATSKMHHNTLHFQWKIFEIKSCKKVEMRCLNETYGRFCINLTITSARFERRAEQQRQAYRLLPGLTT
jgi:hypothetical protein